MLHYNKKGKITKSLFNRFKHNTLNSNNKFDIAVINKTEELNKLDQYHQYAKIWDIVSDLFGFENKIQQNKILFKVIK